MRERTKTNWLFPFQWLSGLPLLLFNHVLPSSFRSTLKMLRLPSESVLYREPPMPPPVEYSLGCIVFVINNHLAFCTKYSSFFEVSACTTLSPTVVGDILNVWILVSVASNRNRSHVHLLPNTWYHKIVADAPLYFSNSGTRAKSKGTKGKEFKK